MWGRTGFCVLPTPQVRVHSGLRRREYPRFGPSGEPPYSIDLAGITITPTVIRWWNDTFAILELNAQPKPVVLIDVDGQVKKTIELRPDIDETSAGRLRIGKAGQLELMKPCAPPHVATDSQGNRLPTAQMQQTRTTYAFQGGPQLEVAPQQGDGPAVGFKFVLVFGLRVVGLPSLCFLRASCTSRSHNVQGESVHS
ncbi:MAG: hypothetical protein LLG45_12615 [Actinomycetia bacterium]|nr:hypothetical protein [Actinomycetes bacterium]